MKPGTKQDKSRNLGRKIRRLALFVVAVALVYFFVCYGTYTVVPGMDTIPQYPPGTTCIIQKNPGSVPVGSVVLIEVENGAGLLSRVAAVRDGTITIRHDNRESVFVNHEERSYPIDRVRGLVLAGLLPDSQPPAEVPQGK